MTMKKSNDWVRVHYKELKKKYPGKYLAVSGKRVIASGSTAKEVLHKVGNKDLRKVRFMHIPRTKTVFY
ncbi:MAG: hypothetical protein ISS48_00580 [Candidatus Aenigmarchaeota archaeon]|nr:hypothetical protein [Candidatus Aenigmarchaeota archaeon]